jgi:hypothetical protein
VPSSNQWIITQPTPCLLRLRASKGVLSRENVNSSAVSGNTMRGAARISGARARVSCRPRLRAHPRLRYRRSQPCAMRPPFPRTPGNARKRFRNTEILTVRNGKIVEAEVYFGWTIPHEAAEGSFIAE